MNSDFAIEYKKQFNDKMKEYFNGSEITQEVKEKYINDNLDRTIYANQLNKELFANILEFYNSSI